MAKRGIFCGKEYGLFGGGMVLCGDTDEPVCSNCVDELTPLSPTERAERALATGRALYPDELQKFLNRERIQQAKKQARLERAHQAIRTDKTCLRCGGPMEKYGTKIFHLGDEGLLGPVARDGLFASWLTAEIIRCAQCGKAEFCETDGKHIRNRKAECKKSEHRKKGQRKAQSGHAGQKCPDEGKAVCTAESSGGG